MPEKMSKAEALNRLEDYTRPTGKYADAFMTAEEEIEGEDDALLVEEIQDEPMTETEVNGLRDFFTRHAKGKYTIRARKTDNQGHYAVVIHLRD
jgi:hypothetical protein